jgi:hypothetical protein
MAKSPEKSKQNFASLIFFFENFSKKKGVIP